jgi:N-methylhydantoinase B
VLDLVRHYGVIVDWGSGELLPRTTEMFRAMLRRRAVAHWGGAQPAGAAPLRQMSR